VRAEQHDEPELVPLTEQHAFRAHQMDKIEMLVRVLQAEGRGLTMVFCRTKRTADQVAGALTTRGFAAAAVHGDLGQAQRERALRAFRHGKVDVLVATDVAARGLDVEDVTHVVNYECPEDEKAYLHRIGRTGRAGRSGVAVTFVDWNDLQRWKIINDALALGHPEPPETYSTSEHFFSALGIPAKAGSRLAPEQRGRQGLEAEELEKFAETGRHRSPEGRRAGGADRRPDATDSGQRRSRPRRRTRGGVPVDGSPAQGAHQAAAGDEASKGNDQPGPRRRRRRGRGRGPRGSSLDPRPESA
jgi:superfamily II DNA/RNA helicase